MKTQTIRLVDVFVLGPFMVWAAARPRALPELARAALLLAGVATVVYNARNYLAAQDDPPQPQEDPP